MKRADGLKRGDVKMPLWGQLAALTTLGLVIGSFLGTIVIRLPEGRSILFGRSSCDGCGATLGPSELVPILGWLVQMGKCQHCGCRISGFYPTIEILAAAVALWAAVSVPAAILPYALVLGWGLLALATMDLRYFRLSDWLSLPLLGLGLIIYATTQPQDVPDHILGAFVGVGSFWVLALLYRRARQRVGMGFGDAKLAGAGGAWLGWQGLPSAVLVACSVALLVLLALSCLGHKIEWRMKVPFGCYLCVGIWIIWLYGPIGFQ